MKIKQNFKIFKKLLYMFLLITDTFEMKCLYGLHKTVELINDEREDENVYIFATIIKS